MISSADNHGGQLAKWVQAPNDHHLTLNDSLKSGMTGTVNGQTNSDRPRNDKGHSMVMLLSGEHHSVFVEKSRCQQAPSHLYTSSTIHAFSAQILRCDRKLEHRIRASKGWGGVKRPSGQINDCSVTWDQKFCHTEKGLVCSETLDVVSFKIVSEASKTAVNCLSVYRATSQFILHPALNPDMQSSGCILLWQVQKKIQHHKTKVIQSIELSSVEGRTWISM